MRIIETYPPNIKEIEKHFDLSGKRPIFAYGNIIFNPHGSTIDQYLLAHEMTHQAQQGDDPVAWWDKYLVDPNFRLQQEVEAYQNQYALLKRKQGHVNRDGVIKYLYTISAELAGPLYGDLITHSRALKLIKNE